jgi:hypothetical protein
VLEPYEGKLSRTVLRGERESNLPDLLDHMGLILRGSSGISVIALYTNDTSVFVHDKAGKLEV